MWNKIGFMSIWTNKNLRIFIIPQIKLVHIYHNILNIFNVHTI